MNDLHWSVVPSLLAAGWLLLAAATLATVGGLPVGESTQTPATVAAPSVREDLPAIVVVASRGFDRRNLSITTQ